MLADGRPHDGDSDRRHSVARHADPSSGGPRQVEAPSLLMRPAIVDPNLDGASVAEVGHCHSRAQRKVPGRSGEPVGIESLAASGLVAGLFLSIP